MTCLKHFGLQRKPSDRAVIAGDESEESDNVGWEKSLPTCPYGKRCYRYHLYDSYCFGTIQYNTIQYNTYNTIQ